MRICYFTKYTAAGASSRYRTYQFVPFLERRGHEVRTFPMFGDQYIEHLYSGKRASPFAVMAAIVRRFQHVTKASRFDVVVVEKELVPWLPLWLERILFTLNPNVVLDYDDAVYVRYAGIPILRSKIPWLMKKCRTVLTGNRTIARFALQFNPRTVVLPTVVDIQKYRPVNSKARDSRRVEVVWIGTPITCRILEKFGDVWQKLAVHYPQVRFKFIGVGRAFRLPAVPYSVVPWSLMTEAEELCKSDIGIMPLEDTEFQRGKSALKIIQYMAAGLPVVASAIGANTEVVEDGKTGFLASSERSWIESIGALVRETSLRIRMGGLGRRIAEERYSLNSAVPCLESVLYAATRKGRSSE